MENSIFKSFGDFTKAYTITDKSQTIKDLSLYQSSIDEILLKTGNKFEGGILHFPDGTKTQFFTDEIADQVSIPSAYLKHLKDAVLVHNHPNGTSLSLEDLAEIIKFKMGGVVIASDYAHYKMVLNRVDYDLLDKNVALAIGKKNEIFLTAQEKEGILTKDLEFNEMHYICSFVAQMTKGVDYGKY